MKAKDPRISELLALVRNTAASRGDCAAAVVQLKAIRADRERQAERKLLVEYLERTRATGDADKIAFAAARLDEFDAKSVPVVPEPGMPAPGVKPAEKSDWQRNHEYWHGPPLPPLGPLAAKVDLLDPSQAFWEREGRQQADRALTAKRTKPRNPPITVWGQDDDLG